LRERERKSESQKVNQRELVGLPREWSTSIPTRGTDLL
jgi:hypothetical protein